jgi:capsular polysaccharide biosynthesis protein
MSRSLSSSDDAQERQWLDDDATSAGEPLADFAANLVSVGFFTAALRRSKWFWRVFAVVGLLVGAGLYVEVPHPYQASTTLLLTVGPEAQPGEAILEDQALAQSRTVAGLTLRKLGLRESVDSFLASYTVVPLTDRVLQITATAPSSSEAVSRASTLATQYLAFRAHQLRAEQQLQFTALDQQVSQDKQRLASIKSQLSQLPASSSQRAGLVTLKAHADSDLIALEQQVNSGEAATKVNTAAMIGGSAVLDSASPLPPHSRLKYRLLFAGGGFIIGLMLGIGIIILRALLSDRLRRRDDVAQALGAPVKLSIPAMRTRRWLLGRRGRVPDRYVQRIVAYLGEAVPTGSRGPAALAVVPIDDPRVAARSVVSLAKRCARQGKRVVVADLCSRAPAAAALGAKGVGVHTVSVDSARLLVAVPDPADFAPVGPLSPSSPRTQPVVADELAASCASADLLLTLITLDPSVGSDHLATWAPEAVVMVTTGQSSWTKINAVGEMIRLAGTRLVSAVLVGADKTDESLGVTLRPEADSDAVTTRGVRADAKGSFADGLVGRPSGPDADMSSGTQVDAAGSFAEGRRRRPSDDSAVPRLQMGMAEQVGHRRPTDR